MEAILILFVILASLAGIGAAAGSFGTDTREVGDDFEEFGSPAHRA